MPFNEKLADRVRELIAVSEKKVEEKMMFGGLSFMVNEKMCVGIKQERIMVRIDPDIFEEALEKEGCTPMIHSGKIVNGFMFVNQEALTTKKKLEYWVNLALAYNKISKPAKKKK